MPWRVARNQTAIVYACQERWLNKALPAGSTPGCDPLAALTTPRVGCDPVTRERSLVTTQLTVVAPRSR
jgi:hypothetical protein